MFSASLISVLAVSTVFRYDNNSRWLLAALQSWLHKNPGRAIVLAVLQIPACIDTLGTQNCQISIRQLDLSLTPLYLNSVRKWNKFSHHVLRTATKGHIKVGMQCMTNSDFLWEDVLCIFHFKLSCLNNIKKWNKSFPLMESKSSLNCRRSKEIFILNYFNWLFLGFFAQHRPRSLEALGFLQ